jgi:hypothetical protein
MTPRETRYWLSIAADAAVLFIAFWWGTWWLPFVIGAYGAWNFYDGLTRQELPR